MRQHLNSQGKFTKRRILLLSLTLVIIVGAGSRLIHSGIMLLDKYLGDALYAVMFYLFLSLFWGNRTPPRKACAVMLFMTAIETFQLTLIPLHLSKSPNTIARIAAIFLGTKFSWLDLLAYFCGIAAISITEIIHSCPTTTVTSSPR